MRLLLGLGLLVIVLGSWTRSESIPSPSLATPAPAGSMSGGGEFLLEDGRASRGWVHDGLEEARRTLQ